MIVAPPEVAADYFILEKESGTWGLCHPIMRYFATNYCLLDSVFEHQNEPNNESLKFLGFFNSEEIATEFIFEPVKDFNVQCCRKFVLV